MRADPNRSRLRPSLPQYSDAEIRERVARLRDLGLLGALPPRALVAEEIADLANACRSTAGALDGLAVRALAFDPNTLRRLSSGMVRGLVALLAERVVL